MNPGFAARGGFWVLAQGPLMLAAMALPPWMGRLTDSVPRWAGIALLVAGLALGLASRRALGISFTPYPKPVDNGVHAVHGPYRFVRHPMYCAIIVASSGWALLWQSIAGAIATAALLVFFDVKARREERWLAQAYAGYAQYRERVRKFVPFVY